MELSKEEKFLIRIALLSCLSDERKLREMIKQANPDTSILTNVNSRIIDLEALDKKFKEDLGE